MKGAGLCLVTVVAAAISRAYFLGDEFSFYGDSSFLSSSSKSLASSI
jgi:hypothetical protein